ncbi:heat shock factor protein 3-like [Hyla sarda]|uniref:heat shock factor protein 3-like n=1 Tax=Hyla sarda TaxID=327740 RepID=UPI0024C35729|nr:heat shock factor protein 3-like [Hyla sarda]
MKEPSTSVGTAPVPAFLMKLWALVEDPSNNDVISWSWNGQNFCILDEQRFSKEILPKYFKHNNLSSFIRQLNMYGFRKVMSLESGLLRSDRSSCIEFQHPFFKKGKSELLENIKRKMSSVKSEEPHLTPEELQKVITELQDLKDVQSNLDTKLENMRRENEALWKEVSALRRRHCQQQKLLSKVLQFILSLMRGNIVMTPKRKRQLTLDSTQSPPPKYSRQILEIPEGVEEEGQYSSSNPVNFRDHELEIHEIFSPGEGTSEASIHTKEQVQNVTVHPVTEQLGDSIQEVIIDDPVLQLSSFTDQNLNPSNSNAGNELALDVLQENSSEDPDSVINSILNENCSNSDLLDRDEIQDFLSCIDASMEELQSMLTRKKLNVESDVIEELFKPDLSSSDVPVVEASASIGNDLQQNPGNDAVSGSDDQLNKDKQLMQYVGNPLLFLYDLSSNSSAAASVDPGPLLTTLEDGLYPCSSAAQNNTALPNNSSKASDLLLDDLVGSNVHLPMFVLSPVNKLIEEATDSEAL